MRIALFVPCFIDALFPETGRGTVSVLRRLGHEVWYPNDQTCCGQVHFNTGYRGDALRLCERFVTVFRDAEVVVAPSASCVAMVREQYSVLAGEVRGLVTEVRSLAARTFELSEFLVHHLGVVHLGARFPYRVALHPTCHSMRSIDVGDAPVRLLQAVDGLELVELPGSDECCGFGGTFSVKNPDTSLAMLDDKIQGIEASGAQVLTAVDDSCLMHIAGGLCRRGDGSRTRPGGVRVMHLAEILATGEGKGL